MEQLAMVLALLFAFVTIYASARTIRTLRLERAERAAEYVRRNQQAFLTEYLEWLWRMSDEERR